MGFEMKFQNILADEKLTQTHNAYATRIQELLHEALKEVGHDISARFPGLSVRLAIKQMYNDEGQYQGVLHFVAKAQSQTAIDAYRYFEEDYASYEWNASIDSEKCSLTAVTLTELLNEYVEDLIDLYKVLTSQQILFSGDISWRAHE